MKIHAPISLFLINKSGIYKIINTKNNKFYIGSSENLYKRILYHKNKLLNNSHYNLFLQRSFNKNRDYFIFEILEFVSKENLRNREQWHINNTKSYLKTIGYNLQSTVNQYKNKKGNKAGRKIKNTWSLESRENQRKIKIYTSGVNYNLLSPWGEIIKGRGLISLCEKYKLSIRNMSLLINKTWIKYNGWLNIDNLPETIKIINPKNNIIYEIFVNELRSFARYHKIENYKAFSKSRLEKYSVYGWKIIKHE